MSKFRLLTAITTVFLLAGGAPLLPAPAGGGCASAATGSVGRALEYLRGRQQPDGGFAEPGANSSEQLTAWTVCAVAAAGENPGAWKSGERSPIDYLLAGAGNLDELAQVERTCLALCCAGVDPRSFGGRNLVAEISSEIGADGRLGDMVSEHCWGVIALAAANEPIPEGCRGWLSSKQNIDGGFGFSEDSASDPDDTGAALQALVAAGEEPGSSVVSRALSYLHFCQGEDGGFKWQTSGSNVGSTSWATQGIAAAGEDPQASEWVKSGKSPVDFLLDMQQSDGHIRYCEESDSNPAWMTAEAIPAILERPFPLTEPEATGERSSGAPSEASRAAASEATTGEEAGSSDNPGPVEASLEETAPGMSTPPRPDSPSGHGVTRGADTADLAPVTASAKAGGGSSNGGPGDDPGGGILPFAVICLSYLFCLGAVAVALKMR